MTINPGTILVELQDSLGSDRSIAEAAWTSSYDKDRKAAKTDEQVTNLVRQLAAEGHATPFETVVFRFWMRIPVMIDRQIMTHRIASHSGLSGRYRTLPEDYYALPSDVIAVLGQSVLWSIIDKYYDCIEQCRGNYQESLDMLKHERDVTGRVTAAEYKRCREVLRGMLGTSFMTERVTTINLRSWANFIRLRLSEHAQPEIRQVAQQMLDLVKAAKICPVAIEALEANDWRI